MPRSLAAALVLLAATPAPGQTPPGEPIPLALRAAAAPRPALEYRLLPDERELEPGNAATLYYRSLASFVENSALLGEIRQEYWGKWLEMPVEDLPREEVGEKLRLARHLLHEVGLAARRRDCDWMLAGRPEGIGLLLPEVQGFRNVAVVLAVRTRWELARGKWQDALRDLQTGYAAARHLSQGPTMIHVLVGAAVANQFNGRLDEFVQLPDAPNLYWALSALPRPYLDPLPAVREDVLMIENMFPWLKRMEDVPMSAAQVQRAALDFQKHLDDFNLRRPVFANLTQAALLTGYHPEAKRYLLAKKYPAEQVEAMPVFQAVVLASFRQYREAAEDVAKWALVEDGFRHPGYKAASQTYRQAVNRLDLLFFRGLLNGLGANEGSIERVYAAARRQDRRFAALRCVEALSLYAAGHGGKLPARLADVAEVPTPADPVTGKPFEYKLDGDTALLTAPLPPGPKPSPAQLLSYEVKVRR
jgi:hypothetical protein